MDGMILGMIMLPAPRDLTSLVIRTEFGNDVAREVLQAKIDTSREPGYRSATYVSDPAFTGVTVQELLEAEVTATEDANVFYLFLAVASCLADREHRLPAVDLSRQGRNVRPARPHLPRLERIMPNRVRRRQGVEAVVPCRCVELFRGWRR